MSESYAMNLSDLDERSARMLFNMVPSFGPVRFQKFMDRFGSAREALQMSAEEWTQVEGLTVAQSEKFHKACREASGRVAAEQKALEKLNARVLMSGDTEYPEALKSIPDAPIVLYVMGDLKPVDSLSVAVVGTRRPSPYGRAAAEQFSRELSQAGVTIVSGLARGIDTVAHATAVKNKGRTVGILGSGFERFYPPENRALAEKMSAHGVVVSEFPLATEPDRGNFPRRNRLISAMSLAVIVVEADETSGALITARLAAEQGRDVFAVPGSIFSKTSRGPHRLIKQGARLTESVDDILDEIQSFRNLIRLPLPAPRYRPAENLTPAEENILKQISLEPVGMDALSVRSGLPLSSLCSVLLGLEIKGLVKSMPGKNYIRSERGLAASAV